MIDNTTVNRKRDKTSSNGGQNTKQKSKGSATRTLLPQTGK